MKKSEKKSAAIIKPLLSAEAIRDLKSIQDYISDEQERPLTAVKVVEKILDRIENLLSFPDTG
ncbi:MAG: type II toxin-antitoxin system RelE/ParE family toxin, partial [Spirochaetaceae bacterium]|nr:type II toxin-antitoxin system RelE/ParE family toxin [Spirochaetaceae bacterium]